MYVGDYVEEASWEAVVSIIAAWRQPFHSTPSPIVRTVPFLFSFSSLLLPPNTFRGSDPAKRILSKRRRSSETFRNRPSGTVDSTWKSLSRIFVNNFRASISKVLIADRERWEEKRRMNFPFRPFLSSCERKFMRYYNRDARISACRLIRKRKGSCAEGGGRERGERWLMWKQCGKSRSVSRKELVLFVVCWNT